MRIFLAGATGVIGIRLVPLLVAQGHKLAGMTRSNDKAESLSALGADPIVCDVFDMESLSKAIIDFHPDLIIHQLTDLPDDTAEIGSGAANSRMRRQGTRNLLTAAKLGGVHQFIAQSIAWDLPNDGGAAVGEHERAVLDAGGTVIRYGRFYGPGTFFESELPPPPHISIDQAARRTLVALGAQSGVIVATDDSTDQLTPTLAPSHKPK